MASPCIGFEIGLGHICWYFRAYICSKILKVLHPCIGFGIGLGHIWGHANAWIWYIHAYAWILYIHVLSHISHIPKAEIFGFMFQYLSSERMGLRFWAIQYTILDLTMGTPFCSVMQAPSCTNQSHPILTEYRLSPIRCSSKSKVHPLKSSCLSV